MVSLRAEVGSDSLPTFVVPATVFVRFFLDKDEGLSDERDAIRFFLRLFLEAPPLICKT